MLQEKAMLANLTIHSWAGRKLDKDVTADVEAKHQANDSGGFSKRLIDKAKLLPITQAIGRMRAMHYERTLPWGDNGDRLLPSTMYLDYQAAMRGLRVVFDSETDAFVHQYPQCVQDARNRLGTMYDPTDYPDVNDIKSKFSVDLSFLPVPDAKDFRVDVGAEEIEAIKQNITIKVMKQQAEAIKDLWHRLRVVISKVEERLSADKAKIYDTLIGNVQDEIELMKKLNLTNDTELNTVINDVEYRLCTIHPDRLRADKSLRITVAASARDILTRIPT